MSYLSFLKRGSLDTNLRWIVKFHPSGKVREVKQIFNPKEYVTYQNHRTLYNKQELIKILENDQTQ